MKFNLFKHSVFIFYILLSLFLSGCEVVGGNKIDPADIPDEKAFGELWFNIYDNSGKIGYIKTKRDKTEFEGKPTVIFRSETYMRNSTGYDKTIAETYYTYDFQPVQEVISEIGTSKNSFSMYKKDRNFVFQSIVGESSSELKLEIPEEKIFAPPDSLFISRVKDYREIKCVDSKYQKIYDVSIKFLENENVSCESGNIYASKYLVKSSILPDSEINIWIDSHGNECICEIAGMKIVQTDQKHAESKNNSKAVAGSIMSSQKIDPDIVYASDSINIKCFESKGIKNSIPSGAYQTISKVGNTKFIKLISEAKNRKTEKYSEESLKPSQYIQSDNGLIKQKAFELKKSDSASTVKALCAWVHDHIKENESGTYLSASEAMISGKGDCTENALLFSAMARSVGIPSRIVSGLIYNGYEFVLHSWSEAYFNNRWYGVDPVYKKVGLNACYLQISYNYNGELSPEDGLKLLNLVNGINLNIRSIYVKNKVIKMEDTSKYFLVKSDIAMQKLWGIRFKIPAKWKFTASESVSLKGKRGDALIFISPLTSENTDIGSAVSDLTGFKVESFYLADMFPRTLGNGRRSLLYSSFPSKTGQDYTCMTYITENDDKDKMLLIVLICPQDKSNFLTSDLDEIDNSLKF